MKCGIGGDRFNFSQRLIAWGLGLIGYLVYLRMRPALAASVVKAVESLNGSEVDPAPALQIQEVPPS